MEEQKNVELIVKSSKVAKNKFIPKVIINTLLSTNPTSIHPFGNISSMVLKVKIDDKKIHTIEENGATSVKGEKI